jgi:hypothetical protein
MLGLFFDLPIRRQLTGAQSQSLNQGQTLIVAMGLKPNHVCCGINLSGQRGIDIGL